MNHVVSHRVEAVKTGGKARAYDCGQGKKLLLTKMGCNPWTGGSVAADHETCLVFDPPICNNTISISFMILPYNPEHASRQEAVTEERRPCMHTGGQKR